MYIFQGNKLDLPISLHTFKGMTEEKALVDSGAMENFIDQQTVDRLKLGTKKLFLPINLHNIDGTKNVAGRITHFIDLIVSRANKKVSERFYVTTLGSDRIILGYSWLRDFNPQIDWLNYKLVSPHVKFETTFYA
jgi:hypothetical protein